jgi:hypothetical protein
MQKIAEWSRVPVAERAHNGSHDAGYRGQPHGNGIALLRWFSMQVVDFGRVKRLTLRAPNRQRTLVDVAT